MLTLSVSKFPECSSALPEVPYIEVRFLVKVGSLFDMHHLPTNVVEFDYYHTLPVANLNLKICLSFARVMHVSTKA